MDMDNNQVKDRNTEMAVKMGLMLALIKILFSTVQFTYFIPNWTMNIGMTVLSVLVSLAVLVYVAVLARKGRGGYISLRQIFNPMFIVILIGVSLSYFYDLFYIHYLEPGVYDQLKQSTISFAERMGAEDNDLDEIAIKFDEEKSKALTLGRISLGLFQSIIFHSMGGFIIAAIFKRKEPVHPIAP